MSTQAGQTQVDRHKGLEVNHVANHNPVLATGQPDFDKRDRVRVSVNDTIRAAFLEGYNNNEKADFVPILMRGWLTDMSDWLHYEEDFAAAPIDDTTGNLNGWDVVEDAGATGAPGMTDKVGGTYRFYTDGDDNDEIYISTGSEAFKVVADKPLLFKCGFVHTANTSGDSSFVFGFSDTVGANFITDAGAIAASFDGIVIFKGEDDANISLVSSNGATQTTTAIVAYTEGNTYDFMVSIAADAAGTEATITIWYRNNGGDWTEVATKPTITISGMDNMHFVMGLKTHEAAEQNMEVDYVGMSMKK